MSLIERLPDGTFKLNDVAVFSCGCNNVVPDTRNKLRMSGVPDVAVIMTTSNANAKKYIKQIGLSNLVPSLKKSSHAVLYNPFTGQYIDLLKVAKTEDLFAKIYKVVQGE